MEEVLHPTPLAAVETAVRKVLGNDFTGYIQKVLY